MSSVYAALNALIHPGSGAAASWLMLAVMGCIHFFFEICIR